MGKLPGCWGVGTEVQTSGGARALGEGLPGFQMQHKFLREGEVGVGAGELEREPSALLPLPEVPPKTTPLGYNASLRTPLEPSPTLVPGLFFSISTPTQLLICTCVLAPLLERKVNNTGPFGKLWPTRFGDRKGLKRQRDLAKVPVSQRQAPGPLPVA